MRSDSSSWLTTLAKLAVRRKRKRAARQQLSRRCGVEPLEARHLLTYLIYLGEDTSNCLDDCPCACSQVGVTKGDAATTEAGKVQYSSQTQSHPVLMFGLEAYSFDTMTNFKAELRQGEKITFTN